MFISNEFNSFRSSLDYMNTKVQWLFNASWLLFAATATEW